MPSIFDLLRKRFCPPGWAYLEEVANGTGAAANRYADGLAMSLWPSRGLEIHGIEVKCSRGDWLRELDDPAKSAPIQKFTHRWWLAITDDGIVQPGELPAAWGLLVAKGGRLYTKVPAPALEAEPLSLRMLAAILRRVSEKYVPRATIRDEIEAARSEAYERGQTFLRKDLERATRENEMLREAVREFEQKSGLSLEAFHGWSGDRHREKMAEAVRFVLAGGMDGLEEQLRQMRAHAHDLVNRIDQALPAEENAVRDALLRNERHLAPQEAD